MQLLWVHHNPNICMAKTTMTSDHNFTSGRCSGLLQNRSDDIYNWCTGCKMLQNATISTYYPCICCLVGPESIVPCSASEFSINVYHTRTESHNVKQLPTQTLCQNLVVVVVAATFTVMATVVGIITICAIVIFITIMVTIIIIILTEIISQ
jgi:hypothetical protein